MDTKTIIQALEPLEIRGVNYTNKSIRALARKFEIKESTFNEIVNNLGITSFYNYYPQKEDILYACKAFKTTDGKIISGTYDAKAIKNLPIRININRYKKFRLKYEILSSFGKRFEDYKIFEIFDVKIINGKYVSMINDFSASKLLERNVYKTKEYRETRNIYSIEEFKKLEESKIKPWKTESIWLDIKNPF